MSVRIANYIYYYKTQSQPHLTLALHSLLCIQYCFSEYYVPSKQFQTQFQLQEITGSLRRCKCFKYFSSLSCLAVAEGPVCICREGAGGAHLPSTKPSKFLCNAKRINIIYKHGREHALLFHCALSPEVPIKGQSLLLFSLNSIQIQQQLQHLSPAMEVFLYDIVFFGSGLSRPCQLMRNFQMDVHDFNKANVLEENNLQCGKKLDRFFLSN